jgi:hypothetical protein
MGRKQSLMQDVGSFSIIWALDEHGAQTMMEFASTRT